MEIKDVLTGVIDHLKESAGEQWEQVKGQAMEYVIDTERRLMLVTAESMTGQLSSEFLVERAKDELTILESQALSFGVISSKFSQELISTTIQKILMVISDVLIGLINKQTGNAAGE